MIRIAIATHKAREKVFKECLPTLINQGERADIFIYLNDYKTVPAWLKKLPVTCVLGKDEAGDLGAAAKFYFTDKFKGVYITADDDIFYDKRYVGYVTDMVYRYNGLAIVGFHGLEFTARPVLSFYNDARYFYFYHGMSANRWVDSLGTGCLAFHTKKTKIHSSMFKHRKMTDAELYAMGKVNKWPMLCLSREANFLRENHKGFDTAIWQETAKDDTKQTEIVNSVSIEKYTAPDNSKGMNREEWEMRKENIKKHL